MCACARVCASVRERDSIANAMKTRCNILIYENISSNPKTGLKRLVSTVKFYIYYEIVRSFSIYITGQKNFFYHKQRGFV